MELGGKSSEKTMKILGLREKAAIEILMLLHEKRGSLLFDIIKGVKVTQGPVYKAIDVLKGLGLVVEKEGEKPHSRLFNLTVNGQRVAEKLYEIENILNQGQTSSSKRQVQS